MAESVEWVDADGTVTTLAGGGASLLRAVQGRFAPPVDFTDDSADGRPGTTLLQVRHDAREVALPLLLDGAVDAAGRREAVRAWAARFDPVRGEGRLRAQVDGLSARELPCRYIGGLEGDESDSGSSWQRFVAVFRAFDPYWRDVDETVVVVEQGELGLWLPWPPVTVVADDVFASLTIVNDGDVVAWPVWTVDGPADEVSIVSGDQALRVVSSVGVNERLVIDTRPSAKTVTDQDGNNRFSSLDVNDDDLFGFPVGTSQVSVSIVGPSAASRVRLSYRRRWLSA